MYHFIILKQVSPGGSTAREYLPGQETNPASGKITWGREWQPTPLFLPGEFHGQRRLAGPSPWGCKRAGPYIVTKQQLFWNTLGSLPLENHQLNFIDNYILSPCNNLPTRWCSLKILVNEHIDERRNKLTNFTLKYKCRKWKNSLKNSSVLYCPYILYLFVTGLIIAMQAEFWGVGGGWPYLMACGILVPWPVIEPQVPALEAWSIKPLDHQGSLRSCALLFFCFWQCWFISENQVKKTTLGFQTEFNTELIYTVESRAEKPK